MGLDSDAHPKRRGPVTCAFQDPGGAGEPLLPGGRFLGEIAPEDPDGRGAPLGGQLQEGADLRECDAAIRCRGDADRAVHGGHRKAGPAAAACDAPTVLRAHGRVDQFSVDEAQLDTGVPGTRAQLERLLQPPARAGEGRISELHARPSP